MSRSSFLGASEIACILGISPFGDAYKVWASKMSTGHESTPTERMQQGLDTEDFVLTQFEKKHNTKVTHRQDRCLHYIETWAGCTLDGLASVDGKTAVVEAKTISTPLYITPPDYYVVQVLWQQFVVGAERGYLAVWSTKDCRFRTYPIHLADHLPLLTEAFKKCRDFWINHVLTKVPPEKRTTERESKDLPDGLLERFCEIQDQQKDLEAEKKMLRQQIIESLGCPEELKSRNSRFQVDIINQTTRQFNKEKLENENPGLTEKYYDQNTTQKLVVKRLSVSVS